MRTLALVSLSLMTSAVFGQSWVKTTSQLSDPDEYTTNWTLSGAPYTQFPVFVTAWSKCDGAVSNTPPWTTGFTTIFYHNWSGTQNVPLGSTGTVVIPVQISDASGVRCGAEGWTYGSDPELLRELSHYIEVLVGSGA